MCIHDVISDYNECITQGNTLCPPADGVTCLNQIMATAKCECTDKDHTYLAKAELGVAYCLG